MPFSCLKQYLKKPPRTQFKKGELPPGLGWEAHLKVRGEFRKILVSVKMFVRNSGAGNGCANFMGAWKNALFLQEKPMSIKFRVLGEGGYFGFFWGVEVPILFLWARGLF